LRAGLDIALRLPAINITPSRSAVFLDTTSNLTTPEDEGDDDDDELRQCAALEPMFSSAAWGGQGHTATTMATRHGTRCVRLQLGGEARFESSGIEPSRTPRAQRKRK
jgi:hypothetical protein